MKTIPFISLAVAHSGQFLWRLKLLWAGADCAKTLLRDPGPVWMQRERRWLCVDLSSPLHVLHGCPLNFWIVVEILGIFSLKKICFFPWISMIQWLITRTSPSPGSPVDSCGYHDFHPPKKCKEGLKKKIKKSEWGWIWSRVCSAAWAKCLRSMILLFLCAPRSVVPWGL